MHACVCVYMALCVCVCVCVCVCSCVFRGGCPLLSQLAQPRRCFLTTPSLHYNAPFSNRIHGNRQQLRSGAALIDRVSEKTEDPSLSPLSSHYATPGPFSNLGFTGPIRAPDTAYKGPRAFLTHGVECKDSARNSAPLFHTLVYNSF